MSHESSGEPGIDQELDYQEEIHSTERTLTNDDGDYSSKEVTESNFTVSAAADRVDVRCGNNGHVCQLFAPKQIQDSDTKKASSSEAETNGHSNGQSSHKNLMVGTHSNSSRNGYSRSDELGSYDPPKLSSYDPKCSSVSERNQTGAEEMVTGYRSPYIPQSEGCSQNVPNIPVNPKRATRRQLLFTAHRWPSQWPEKSAAVQAETPKYSLCTTELHPKNVDLEHGTSIGELVTGHAGSIRSQVGRFFLSTGRASDHDPGTDTFFLAGTHSNSGYSCSDELSSYDPPKLSSCDPKCRVLCERRQSGAEEMVTGYRSPYIPQNEGCSQNVPNIPINPKRATRRQLLFTAHRWPSQWSEKSVAERAEQPKCSLCTNEIHPMNVDLEHGTSIGKLVTGYAESIRSQMGRFFLSTGRASDHDPGTDTFILSLHLRIPAGNNLQAQHLHSSLQVGTHSNSSRNGYSDSDELSSYEPPKLSSCDRKGRVLCERSLSGAEEMITGRYSYIPQNGSVAERNEEPKDTPLCNDEIHPRNEVLSNSTSTSGGELVTGHSESSRSQVGRFCLSTSRVSDQDPHNYTNPGTDTITLCFHLTIPIGNILQAQNLHYHR